MPSNEGDKEDQLSYEENVCHRYACAIQECLRRKSYDERKCRNEIEKWKACLKKVQEEVKSMSETEEERSK